MKILNKKKPTITKARWSKDLNCLSKTYVLNITGWELDECSLQGPSQKLGAATDK